MGKRRSDFKLGQVKFKFYQNAVSRCRLSNPKDPSESSDEDERNRSRERDAGMGRRW